MKIITTRLRAFLCPIVFMSQLANADFLVSRAFREEISPEFERVFLSEITRSPTGVSVAPPVEINAPLIDRARVWSMLSFPEHKQLVYGVFDPDDVESLDELHLINLRLPTGVQRLNALRSDPANQFIVSIASSGTANQGPAGGSSARLVYVLRDTSTSVDTLYLADTRSPGTAVAVATLPTGSKVDAELLVSPDGSIAAYSVEPAAGPHQVAVTFLNQPSNLTTAYSNSALTEYRPVEFAFSDDSRRLFWIDSGAETEPGHLQSVELNPLEASNTPASGVGRVVQVSAANLVNERVSEFSIKPSNSEPNGQELATETKVAYRSFAAGSSAPSDTYLAELSAPGFVTKLNDGPAQGAVFTTWEDVLWRSNSVLYNATEDFLELADLFTVAESNPGNPTSLSRQVPFSTQRPNAQAAGVSHFVQSPDDTRTAMIDGDPAVNIFVIDQFNIGASQEPFTMTANRSLGDITDPANQPPRFSPGSDMIATVIRESLPGSTITQNVYVASADSSHSEVAVLNTGSPQVFQYLWFDDSAAPSSASTALAAAVLPASRSAQVGSTITAFVTLLNGGDSIAQQCAIDLISNVPARLSYQTTNAATNAPTGSPNQAVDIPARGSQSFVISVALNAAFSPRDATLAYTCANAPAVAPLPGLNTLLLSASTSPVSDVIALAATASADGILRLDSGNSGAFSVASVNVGAGSELWVSANSGADLQLAVCQTNPTNGACIGDSVPSVQPVGAVIDAGATPTFSVFATANTQIEPNAANNRVNVVFRDQNNNVRGQTSVAIQSAP